LRNRLIQYEYRRKIPSVIEAKRFISSFSAISNKIVDCLEKELKIGNGYLQGIANIITGYLSHARGCHAFELTPDESTEMSPTAGKGGATSSHSHTAGAAIGVNQSQHKTACACVSGAPF